MDDRAVVEKGRVVSQRLPGENYLFRVSVAILLLLGGLFFLPLSILGGLVVWSLIDDLRNSRKPEDRRKK